MGTARKATPLPVARQLRQEAGFGCCKCGLAIYEYHHIEPYTSADPHFRPEDMMILCPLHHHEATVRAMTIAEQRDLKGMPFNLKRGYVDGLLKVNQRYPGLGVGTNQFIGDRWFVRIDGADLVSLSIDDRNCVEISAALYDSNDQLIALIERNEWVAGDPMPWDLESEFQRITLRRKARDIALRLDAKADPVELRADLWKNGQHVELSPDAISVGGRAGKIQWVNLCLVGLGIEINSGTRQVSMVPDPRFEAGFIVSHASIPERLRRGRFAWLKLMYGQSFEGVRRNDPCPCGSGQKLKRCHIDEIP